MNMHTELVPVFTSRTRNWLFGEVRTVLRHGASSKSGDGRQPFVSLMRLTGSHDDTDTTINDTDLT